MASGSSYDCDDDECDRDGGDTGFGPVEPFLAERGTTIDLVDAGVGGAPAGTGGYIDSSSQWGAVPRALLDRPRRFIRN